MTCLVDLFKRDRPTKTKAWKGVNAFAYQAKLQTSHLSLYLKEVLSKASQFRQCQVAGLEFDISTCFDSISVKLIVNALAFWNFHPRPIAAYIFDILYFMGHANVAGISSTSGFPMQKLRQGGPDGPFIFDVVCRYLTLQVYQAWDREGVSRFLFDDGSIDGSLVWWADNGWLLSTCGYPFSSSCRQ